MKLYAITWNDELYARDSVIIIMAESETEAVARAKELPEIKNRSWPDPEPKWDSVGECKDGVWIDGGCDA